MTQAGA